MHDPDDLTLTLNLTPTLTLTVTLTLELYSDPDADQPRCCDQHIRRAHVRLMLQIAMLVPPLTKQRVKIRTPTAQAVDKCCSWQTGPRLMPIGACTGLQQLHRLTKVVIAQAKILYNELHRILKGPAALRPEP